MVKGRVLDLKQAQPQAARVLARIRVDAVLKGEWSVDTILVWVPNPRSASTEILDYVMQDQYALFFLSQDGEQFVPVDRRHIKIEVREGRPAAPEEPSKPLEKMREELLFTASAPIDPAKEAVFVQQAEEKFHRRNPAYKGPNLRDFFASQLAHINTVAAWQLGQLPLEERTLGLLESLLSSPSRSMKQAAVTALLSLSQPEALKAAVELIDSTSGAKVPSLIPYEGEPDLIEAISAFENDDPEAVAILSAMLKRPSVELRRAALAALSQVPPASVEGTQERLRAAIGVPFLAQALDDEDVRVRYEAMSRLARITGIDIRRPPWPGEMSSGSIQRLRWAGARRNEATPNAPADEKKYLDFWKQWWLTQGKPALEAVTSAPK